MKTLEEQQEALEVQIEALQQPTQKVSDMLFDAHSDYFKHYDEVVESGDVKRIKEWRTKTQAAIRRFIRRVSFNAQEFGILELTYISGTVRDMDYRDYIKPKGFQKGNRNGVSLYQS